MNLTTTSNITLIRIAGPAGSGRSTIAQTLKDGLRGIAMILEEVSLAGLKAMISHCKSEPVPVYIILDDCSLSAEELKQLHVKILTISSSCN